MIPDERSLVTQFKDRPFTILAVNSDPQDTLRKLVDDKVISWPAIFDGGDTFGPLAGQWNVTSWPTLYLIDKEGRIRARPTENSKDLAVQIEKLLLEK